MAFIGDKDTFYAILSVLLGTIYIFTFNAMFLMMTLSVIFITFALATVELLKSWKCRRESQYKIMPMISLGIAIYELFIITYQHVLNV